MGERDSMKAEITEGANLISQRKLDRAIDLLNLLDDNDLSKEDAGMKHLHLAIAFGKKRDIDQSNYHYRKAIEYDHPTGMAYEKLAINLTKQGKLEEALEVCQRLLDHPMIPQPRSYLTKDSMRERKKKLEARLTKNLEKDSKACHAT